MIKRLQVWNETAKEWRFVFCANKHFSSDPIETSYRHKAIKAIDYEWFKSQYANHIFQVVK